MTYRPDRYQVAALATWYAPDNPLYLDPRHPLIKLAGEAGEILDLYGKNEYKPGFSWWDCKYCKKAKSHHTTILGVEDSCHPLDDTVYTPLVLDEIGDFWYYLRIVDFQRKMTIDQLIRDYPEYQKYYLENDLFKCLVNMSRLSADVLYDYVHDGNFELGHFQDCAWYFLTALVHLDYSLDALTDLNYAKLNSEATAHGWKNATIKSEVK